MYIYVIYTVQVEVHVTEIVKCPTLGQTIEIQKKSQVSKQDRKNRQVSDTCKRKLKSRKTDKCF